MASQRSLIGDQLVNLLGLDLLGLNSGLGLVGLVSLDQVKHLDEHLDLALDLLQLIDVELLVAESWVGAILLNELSQFD